MHHKNVDICYSWFFQHSPFHQESGELINIDSGMVADDKVTCDQPIENPVYFTATEGKEFSIVVIHKKYSYTDGSDILRYSFKQRGYRS